MKGKEASGGRAAPAYDRLRDRVDSEAARVERAELLALASASGTVPPAQIGRLAADAAKLTRRRLWERAADDLLSGAIRPHLRLAEGGYRPADDVLDRALFDQVRAWRNGQRTGAVARARAALGSAGWNAEFGSGSAPAREPINVDWQSAFFVDPGWPGSAELAAPVWPWGAYTTPELEMIADAVREFWIRWDGETSSAPKNEVVICWLEGRGMSNNLAKATASIIRSPMVPAGQRPRRDSWA